MTPSSCTLPSESDCNTSLPYFSPVTFREVHGIITKSPAKSSRLDPWPTWMVKLHLNSLIPIVTSIVSQSLSSAVFPSEWKRAVVTPLLKRPSADAQVFSNYRPVSNLPFISKVVERVVANKLSAYLLESDLYPRFQSAYRKNHSVETALLRVQNDILQAIDTQEGVILILLDLSAAFDTISHDILLFRLKQRFGLTGNVLRWIASYLDGRSQVVVYNGQASSPLPVPHGVPQGSVLGPMLFSLYTSPICDIVDKHNMQFHLYADDAQVYLRFNFKTSSTTDTALTLAEQCISDVSNWMTLNKLKLNCNKTEFMILTSPRIRPNLATPDITIGDCPISASSTLRNLGSWFDQSLTMDEHVKAVCKTCYFHLHNIAAIRNSLTRNATEKLMHAFITSRLDSCNSLLINVSATSINKLQRVQNTAARIVTRKTKRDSISSILKDLHWLPIKQRIMFKAMCVTHKCVYGQAPTYLSELIHLYVPTRSLRSADKLRLSEPSARLKTYGDRSFAVAAPKMWNNLPLSLRECSNFDSFKKVLKTFLFRNAMF